MSTEQGDGGLREALEACEEVLRLVHEAAGPVPTSAPMPKHCTFEAWKMAVVALALMQMGGGPSEPHWQPARVAITTYLRHARSPASRSDLRETRPLTHGRLHLIAAEIAEAVGADAEDVAVILHKRLARWLRTTPAGEPPTNPTQVSSSLVDGGGAEQ